MNLDLELQPRKFFADWHSQKPLRFSWDSETGKIRGADADQVRALVKNYAGKPYGAPHRVLPETWCVVDPLHRPADMAALLGAQWELPPELEAVYPQIRDATLGGELN